MSLIKCPECGDTVSDKAPICPHCGFAIAQNFIKCPECGSMIPNNSVLCPKCAFPLKQENGETKEQGLEKIEPAFSDAKTSYESKLYIIAYNKINIALSASPNNQECLKLKEAIVVAIRDNSFKLASDLFKEKEYTKALAEIETALLYVPNNQKLIILQNDIKKAKSRRRIIISVISILIFAAVATSIVYFAYHANTEKQENEAWTEAKDSSTVSSLEHFMELYPNGSHSIEAEQLLLELKKKDSDYWESIRLSSDVSKFKDYTIKFPNGTYMAQANNCIDSLDWVQAVKTNTAEAYSGYLSSHPNGVHSSEASTAGSKITSMTASTEDIESMKNFFSTYYAAVEGKDYNSVLDFFETVTARYYELTNAKKTDILANLKKLYSKDIRQVHIKVSSDNFKVTKDESGNYHATFSIDVNYDREDESLNTSSNMIVNAVVDQNQKITSITSKKLS